MISNKKIYMAGFIVLVMAVALFMLPNSVFADTPNITTGITDIKPAQGSGSTNLLNTVGLVINVLLSVIGVIAVVMLIIGGIRYTTSQGDEKAILSAKNTILYAIIGIVVAFVAWALVAFVIGQLTQNQSLITG